jgi:hypothetical protein
MIIDADGTLLGARHYSDSEGIVTAEITPGPQKPTTPPPQRYWLHRRGILPRIAWTYQRTHGRRHYRRHHHLAQPADSNHPPSHERPTP